MRLSPGPAPLAAVTTAGGVCQAESSRKVLPNRGWHGTHPRVASDRESRRVWGGGRGVGATGESRRPLTLHGLDLVGDVEAAQRGERAQEGGHVGGALEALRGGLHALPVVDLQVDDGPEDVGAGLASDTVPGVPRETGAPRTQGGRGGREPGGDRHNKPGGGRHPSQTPTPPRARPPQLCYPVVPLGTRGTHFRP